MTQYSLGHIIPVLLLTYSTLLTSVSVAQTKPKTTSPQRTAAPRTTTNASRTFDDLSKRAEEAWKNHQFTDAAKLYRQALNIRPSWPEGWGFLASALYQLERYPEARDAYRQTTILTPKNAPSWAYLGLCEYELRDYQRAFDDLAKAETMGLGEDHDLTAQVKYHMAILWNTAGQFEKGLGEMLFFPSHNLGSPEIIQVIGLSVLRTPIFPYEIPKDKQEEIMLAGEASFAANSQHLDLAQKIYSQLVEKYPNEPNIHFAYGQFLSHTDLDGALKEYEKEIALNPAHAYARIEAAYLYLKMGELERALAHAQEAVKLQPRYPAAHNLLGRVLVELDRTADAISELAEATRLAPENSSFHLNLARAYQKAGETTMAAKEIATFNELEKKRAAQQPAKPTPQ
jgi:tetratricopeptide (TPR) repeat protein